MATESLYVELNQLEQQLRELHQKELQILQRIDLLKESTNQSEVIKTELKKIFQKI